MMTKQNPQVKVGPGLIGVGVGILVFKNGKILLGKRKSLLGKGEYAGLGGHLEFGESIEECAKREAMEEAGVKLKNIKFLCLSSLKKYHGKHYIDIGLKAEWAEGEPKNMEPDKCEGYAWYGLDNLPSPLFGAELNYLEALKSGKNFFDS